MASTAAATNCSVTESLDLFTKNLQDITERQTHLNQKFKTVNAALDHSFGELEAVVTKNKANQQELSQLSSVLQQIERDYAETKDETLQQRMNACRLQLMETQYQQDHIKSKRALTGSLFLSLVLGHVNVRLWKRGEILTFKEEYNRFKQNTTYLYILFPVLQLFLCSHRILGALHQLWLLYYYTALAVRENILKANGSDIKSWWIVHHYLSMAVSMVVLLWPSSLLYSNLSYLFLWFLLAQGVIMFVQNKYQNKRHYVRRSLGKASEIDVASSETLSEKPTDLKILVPLLFLTYCGEVFLGAASINSTLASFSDLSSLQWQPLVLGFLFIVLGVGNAVTTYAVLRNKKAQSALRRRMSLTPKTAPKAL